nr:MAG TPA: hypothetical protein [Caudoviricetes sp.]
MSWSEQFYEYISLSFTCLCYRAATEKVATFIVLGRLRKAFDFHTVACVERAHNVEERLSERLGASMIENAVCDNDKLVVFLVLTGLRVVVHSVNHCPCVRVREYEFAKFFDSLFKVLTVGVVENVVSVHFVQFCGVGNGVSKHSFLSFQVVFCYNREYGN